MKQEKLIPTCIKETFERRSRTLREEDNNEREDFELREIQPNDESSNNQPITTPPESEAGSEPQNSNEFTYRVDGEYPEITDIIPSLFEVKQLKFLNYSRNGELTAINTYLYQFFVLQNDYPEIATALREISVVEMEHFEKLGEAIVEFGGNPNLTDGRGNVWTGRNVLQLRNPRDILIANIRAEERAICEYQRSAARTQNESLRALFERIIEDEKNHIIIFNELLGTL